MPNHLNAYDSPFFDRKAVMEDLYIQRGAEDASHRCDVNSTLGDFDLLETLVQNLKLSPGETLFDVGCGSGQHLVRLREYVQPGGQAHGFDISPEAVAAARQRGVEAVVADAAFLPVPDASADALTCNFAIYYHPQLLDVIAEWQRVLKSRGNLVISGPAADTNLELYQFHREVTRQEPSDADLMALGYVEGKVQEALKAVDFGDVHLQIFTNRIRFPDPSSFLAYWKSTSLFTRTPGNHYEVGKAKLMRCPEPFILTKRVAVITAWRR
jgi:ubiquinone/menaquinone biosynthesis C-methylase UbiE